MRRESERSASFSEVSWLRATFRRACETASWRSVPRSSSRAWLRGPDSAWSWAINASRRVSAESRGAVDVVAKDVEEHSPARTVATPLIRASLTPHRKYTTSVQGVTRIDGTEKVGRRTGRRLPRTHDLIRGERVAVAGTTCQS